ncbi:MAG: hypothetical protein FWC79_08180 [Oscillospiraceae bacterium]|nr:hypothetical protein [Oscillospiraceae bacterium]
MKKNVIKKYISIVLILTLGIYSFLGLFAFEQNTSEASTMQPARTSTNIAGIDETRYPGYRERIQALQNQHPNWNFVLFYTGIDWNEAVTGQLQGHGATPTSLFEFSAGVRDGDWHCHLCGVRGFDTGVQVARWRCASKEAVAFQMDPRNFLTSQQVFQFQNIGHDPRVDWTALQTAVRGTFLYNSSFISAMLTVSQERNINAMFIAARIIQEQGANPAPGRSPLSSGEGWHGQYVGYFNFFNIGATGNSDSEVVLNGLRHARNMRMEYSRKINCGRYKFSSS